MNERLEKHKAREGILEKVIILSSVAEMAIKVKQKSE